VLRLSRCRSQPKRFVARSVSLEVERQDQHALSEAKAIFRAHVRKLFQLAEVQNGHAHRFRDTFAVELLLARVPIERVSILLGHQSVRITEKHYAPWVRSRQEQLEADLPNAWSQDPLILLETKGTPEVHGSPRRVN